MGVAMMRITATPPRTDPILEFYIDVLDDVRSSGTVSANSKILVVAGGANDRSALTTCEFTNVVISNLDDRMTGSEFAPYSWSYQDAEALAYDDEEFDFCIVHSGLHHCRSPHAALLEMHRVARRGLIVFEPHDSITTKLGLRLGVGQTFEHAAVFYNDFAYGGLRNSPVPNYVYRFTAHEIEKTITTAFPFGKHDFRFHFRNRIPSNQLKARNNKLPYLAMKLLSPLVEALGRRFPQMSNNFAVVILKPTLPDELFPWLRPGDRAIGVDEEWFASRYSRQRKDVPLPQ